MYDLQRQEFSVLVECELGLGNVIAAVPVGDKTFRTIRYPFHRPANPPGGPGDDGLLAIVKLLDPETAADIRGHHPHLLLGNVQHQRAHQEAHHVRKLAGGPQRVMAGAAIILGDRCARLHRVADQAIVDEAEARHMRRLAERGRDRSLVAQFPVAAQIIRHVVEQLRGARTDGFEHADHRRQHLIIDHDRFRGRARQLQRIGDDEGDHIADETHLALRKHRKWRLLHRQAV